MTEPVRVGELLPSVLGEVVDRAGHGYERWAELVAQAGYCHHRSASPAGSTTPTARAARSAPSTTASGSRTGCCSRRAAPAGSRVARRVRPPTEADAYQLLAAGLRGGKGIPNRWPGIAAVRDFTAPSFGRVHRRKAQGRLVLPCHPYRQGARCPHGTRDGCWHRHDEDDPRLGEPLWPATTVRRKCCGTPWPRSCGGGPPSPSSVRPGSSGPDSRKTQLRRLVRVSYAKVAEFQRRGAIHFHAVIRLDAATECRVPAA